VMIASISVTYGNFDYGLCEGREYSAASIIKTCSKASSFLLRQKCRDTWRT
jgi:hypothetical protein